MYRQFLSGLILISASVFAASAAAVPVVFTYNCTISGAAPGTNICDQGPEIAQLTIAETSVDGVLSLSILRLFPAGLGGADDLTLQAIHLNFAGDYNSLPILDNPPVNNPKNDTNSLEYSENVGFNPYETIEVVNNSTTALNYKGFDVQLCDTGIGLCDVAVTFTDTIFGYIRSGNSYNLTPEMFDAVTENSANANNPDRARTFDGCEVSLQGLKSAVKIVEATSPQGDRCSNSDNANGYGPYYGALEGSTVIPEPSPLALLGAGLLALGLVRRRRRAA